MLLYLSVPSYFKSYFNKIKIKKKKDVLCLPPVISVCLHSNYVESYSNLMIKKLFVHLLKIHNYVKRDMVGVGVGMGRG